MDCFLLDQRKCSIWSFFKKNKIARKTFYQLISPQTNQPSKKKKIHHCTLLPHSSFPFVLPHRSVYQSTAFPRFWGHREWHFPACRCALRYSPTAADHTGHSLACFIFFEFSFTVLLINSSTLNRDSCTFFPLKVSAAAQACTARQHLCPPPFTWVAPSSCLCHHMWPTWSSEMLSRASAEPRQDQVGFYPISFIAERYWPK